MAFRCFRSVSRTCALCHKGQIGYNFGRIYPKEVNGMRKIVTLLLCLLLIAAPAGAVSVLVDGVPLESDIAPVIINSTTYVPLRAAAEALREDAMVAWEGQAVVRAGSDLELTAAPGAIYLEANGRALYIADGVQAVYGRVLVPVRVLAKAMDAQVEWDGESRTVSLTSGAGAIEDASLYYKEDELYWLSRIISAESRGEPLLGKIAVGNVVLNRVAHSEFPATIYGVIFDDRWGGQFEPVSNGTIHQTPTQESVLAARLVLDGADAAADSLYFLAPALTDNHWIMENRTFVMRIGAHWFYR